MRIELGAAHTGRRYWTVLVEENELVTESGKVLPYSTTIGTVDERGKVSVWTPAASKPRDYKRTALELLEQARASLIQDGAIKAPGRHADARFTRQVLATDTMHHNNYVAAYGGSRRNTLAQAKEEMDLLGIAISKRSGEYRVNFRGGDEGTAYYTDDLGDAVATGRDMALRRK